MAADDQQSMCYRYELGPDEAPSTGVVTVMAALENELPLELPPLAAATDPDALDALLATDGKSNSVSFDFCGYAVTATPDEVRVRHPNTK